VSSDAGGPAGSWRHHVPGGLSIRSGALRLLLASSSAAALLIGAGAPPALAACGVTQSGGTVASVSNSGATNCIFVQSATVTGSVTNTGTGVLTATGGASPSANGITISLSTIGGSVSNAGVIHANNTGISVTDNSTVASGITNSGTVSASIGIDAAFVGAIQISNGGRITARTGIAIGDIGNGPIGITNSGTIAAQFSGIIVSGNGAASATASIRNAGLLTVAFGTGIVVGQNFSQFGSSTASGGVVNSGTIAAGGMGIVVGGIVANGPISNGTFFGGVSNGGKITWGGLAGILVGEEVVHNFGTFAAFFGGVANTGTISGINNAILVGGVALSGATLTVSTFSGGVSNAGMLSANGGIVVGGIARSTNSHNVLATFAGGITNAGTIAAGNAGIIVGGFATGLGASVVVSTFAGGVTNSGLITVASGPGIEVGGAVNGTGSVAVSNFTGGITNTGTISGGGATPIAIQLDRIGSFGGDIVNAAGASMAGAVVIATNLGVGVSHFTGNISNAGTISANTTNIRVARASTFTGNIVNSGMLTGASGFAIRVELTSTFAGAIINSGSIAQHNGILVSNASVFGTSSAGGGILNTGTIAASGAHGIEAVNDATFLGGITNAGSGTITGASIAIQVAHVSTFAGGLSNAGVISGVNFGILVTGGVGFAPGSAIVNTGTISGAFGAIDVKQATSPVTIAQAGVINGDINLSTAGNADVVNVTGGTINGNVVAAGNAGTVNFTLGSGSFTYAAPFAMTGLAQVNVNSGTAFVDGSIGATAIDINGGGTVAGTGTLAGAVTVFSGGTLMPGHSPGTITVSGSLTLNAGSFYSVHVTQSAASATTIGGTATLNGGATVVVTLQQNGNYNQTYTIVTASSGVSGTFNPTVTNAGGLTFNGSETLTYDADHVYLTLSGSTSGLALPSPGNLSVDQQNALNAINAAIKNGATLPPGFQALFNLSGPGLANALTQLEGEATAGFFQGAFQAGNSFLGLMVNPFLDGRFGNGGGFGAAIGFAAEAPQALPQAALAFASAMRVKAPAVTFEQRFSIWGAAYGGSGRVLGDTVLGSHDTTATAAAFAAGIDYRLSPDTIVGVALAGGGTGWNVTANLGSGSSDMFQAGVYASHHWGAAYVSGAVAYNFHDVTTNRTVTIAGTDMLQARFQANGLGARIEGGYRFATPWLGFTPYAAAQVQSIALPNYAETATAGSNQFALNVAAQTATTTRTELGAWLDRKMPLQNGALLTLYGRAAWAHDEGNSPSASAIFQALPGSNFIVNGAVPARDGALVTGAAQYGLASGWSFLAKFDGEFSSTTSVYSGSGMVKKTW
jgi:outer membrane autotransporter protein